MLIPRTNYDAPLNAEIKIIILSDSRKMYRKEGILTFATKTITGTKNIAYITWKKVLFLTHLLNRWFAESSNY